MPLPPQPPPNLAEVWKYVVANEARIAALEARNSLLEARNAALERGLKRRT